MKNSLRILALLCALLMLLTCFVGCRKDPDDNKGNGGGGNGSLANSSLPAADWNGEECLVLGHSGAKTKQFENLEIWREEMTDDVVGKAVWERNTLLKETYNFEVKQNLVDVVKNEMADLYKSGEDLYDICLYRPLDAAQHAEQEFLLDLASVEYIDLDHASWDQNARNDLAITGKLYFTVSDFLLQDKDRTEVLFYNREMARVNGWGYLEDQVTGNGWTVEYFAGLVKAASKDGNSNLTLGEFKDDGSGDYFGLGLPAYQSLATFAFGAGVKISYLDDAGEVVIVNDKEATGNVIDAVGVFLFNKTQSLFVTDLPNTEYQEHIELFGWEKELFCSDVLSSLDRIHTGATISQLVDFEYSFLPYPKANASQDRYYSTPSGTTGAVVAIPYTVSDAAQSGFFLQALSEASTDTTLVAYYEIKCKIQNAQDQRASDMLDILFESVRYDVGAMYDFGGLATMYTDFAKLKRNRFENQFDSRYQNALIAAQEIMDNFND